MKVAVTLLCLAVAAQAQYPYYSFSGFNYAPYSYAVAPAPVVKEAPAPVTYTYPATYSYPYTYSPYAYAPAYTANQYHAQDELGQASFGYSHPGQAAVNYRDAFGNQVGSYAYINPEGKEIKVSYVADSNGFRVLSNALPEGPAVPEAAPLAMPEPVQDTPEVAAAKAEHFAAIEAAKANDGKLPEVPAAPVNDLEAPQPVEDTAEVKQAKAEFFAAYDAAAAAAAAAGGDRKKRQVLLSYPFTVPASTAPLTYTLPVAAAPLTYSAPVAVAAPVAAPSTPVREATLSKTVHNPGHAVSYRVD